MVACGKMRVQNGMALVVFVFCRERKFAMLIIYMLRLLVAEYVCMLALKLAYWICADAENYYSDEFERTKIINAILRVQ